MLHEEKNRYKNLLDKNDIEEERKTLDIRWFRVVMVVVVLITNLCLSDNWHENPHKMLHKGPRCLEHKINKAINGRKDYKKRFELSKGSNVLSKEMIFYYLQNKYVNLLL